MDQSWTDGYTEAIEKESKKIVDLAEESYGYRPEIRIQLVPVYEIETLYTRPDGGWATADRRKITPQSIVRTDKPSLMARRIGRGVEYSSTVAQGNHAPLHTKETYLRAKETGRQFYYTRYTVEQLEAPPTKLEKLLHPGVARRVARKQEAIAHMAAPPGIEYRRVSYARYTDEPVFDYRVEDIVRE